jgi:3-hydroxy acid dehydrogenase/malonic semialdehyde reductase
MSNPIVITGASSGIGEACALAFAREGRSLILGARRADKLEQVAQACRKSGAPEVQVVPLDVRSLQSITAFAELANAAEPSVLINNAGLAKGRELVAGLRDEDLTEMIEVNVTGFLRVARAFLPGMIARKNGHVINLGSLAGRQVYEGGAVYCATKFAVKAITQTLRLELSGTNIRVTEVAPGLVETEFSVVRTGDVDKAKAVYQGFVPLTAIDIADCVIWAVNRPAHVNISEIVLTPVAQASVSKVHRQG